MNVNRFGNVRLLLFAMMLVACSVFTAPAYAACSNPAGDAGVVMYNADHYTMQYCDDTDWRAMSLGFVPSAIYFQSTNDTEINSGGTLTGVTDSKQWTGSFWFRFVEDNEDKIAEFVDTQDSTSDISAIRSNNNRITVSAENSGGTDILYLQTNNQYFDTDWHHVMFSADLATGQRHLYIDGVEDLNTGLITLTDDTIDFTPDGGEGFVVGGSGGIAGNDCACDMAEVWMDFGTYIDLSNPVNRAKFFKDARPVYLGDDGSTPTGTSPDIFLTGPVANWPDNAGTGGAFSVASGGLMNTNPPPHGWGLNIVGSFTDADYIDTEEIVVQDDYAYAISDGSDKLFIVDVSDPTSPSQVSELAITDLAQEIAVEGPYAYVPAGNSIHVIDVSDKANPQIIGTVTDAVDLSNVFSLGLRGNYIFAGSPGPGSGYLTVVNVADKTAPSVMGSLSSALFTQIDNIVPIPGSAYVIMTSTNNAQLITVDITNPSTPSIADNVSIGTNLREVVITADGTTAFFGSQNSSTLYSFDISDPTNLTPISTLVDADFDSNTGLDISGNGNFILMPGQANDLVALINVTDPSNMVKVATLTDTLFDEVDDVTIYGRYGYAVGEASGDFTVIDLFGNMECVDPHGIDGSMIYNADAHAMMFCAEGEWLSMDNRYMASAVTFDGSDRFDRGADLTGVSDSNTFTLSMWIKALPSDYGRILSSPATNDRFVVSLDDYFASTSGLVFRGKNSAGTDIVVDNSINPIADNQWHHVLISVDTAAGVGHFYIDGTSQGVVGFSNTDAIDFTEGDFAIGHDPNNGWNPYIGDIADLWFDTGTYIDFSSATQRELFADAEGNPVYLGENGSLPTGSVPDIFMSGDVSNWPVNKGTGGAFTQTGTLTAASTTPALHTVELERGLVAHWPFDETEGTIADDIAGDNLGTESGGVTFDSAGQIGTAFEFDGSDDMIALPDDVYDALSEGTISVWVKWNGASAEKTIFTQRNGPDYFQPLQIDDGEVYLFSENACNTRVVTTDTPVTADTWTHLAYTSDASGHKIYVNGVHDTNLNYFQGSATDSAFLDCNASGTTTSYFIGGRPSTEYFDGAIDDFRIYDRALSAAEVTALYNAGTAGRMYPDSCSNPSGVEGQMVYNSSFNIMQFCNGSDWIGIGKD